MCGWLLSGHEVDWADADNAMLNDANKNAIILDNEFLFIG
jgi:hypothetical protein